MNNIITLCGSTRFKEDFLRANEHFTLNNYIVLMPGVFGHSDGIIISDSKKEELDKLHKRKIDMSDSIYVINKNGYIGDSTRSEIEYAKSQGKPIYYMEGDNK